MNFSDAQKVQSTITQSDELARLRAENRVKINELFDGFPPLSKSRAEKIGMKVNCNWLEGKVIEQQACRQYDTAFTRQANYFKVFLPLAPEPQRRDWELNITQFINQPMKRSRKYFELIRAKFATVVRHGVGAQIWPDQHGWIPEFVPIEDFRVPTDTRNDMENLVWFGVRKAYTPGELAKKVFGRDVDPGWDKQVIAKILNEYRDTNVDQVQYDWYTQPEKMLDLYKQDMGYYMSDSVPVIPVWHFYYLDEETDPQNAHWCLKVVPADYGIRGVEKSTFLYETPDDADFGRNLSELLHVQFGDLSGKAPFMINAVRSLGFLLMEPCFWMNLTRCRLVQHVWENFNLLLRGTDPEDRARSQKVELFDKGWIPNEVQIVPREQRHQIDAELVSSVMAQMKQLMGESSAAYTQDIDQGTRKERTAFEVMTMMQSVNSMLSGLLNTAFQYETFAYREIGRRFCIKDSPNKDVQQFWQNCKRAGIPMQWLNVNLWDIQPDVPLGSGNPTLELAQAKELMGSRGAYSGEAQQEILHMYTAAITNNARLAQKLAPVEQGREVNDAQRDAEFAFGTLMQGVPVRMKDGLNPIDQIDTLLGLTAGVVARIEKIDGMGTIGEVVGLSTVMQYVNQLVVQLASDPEQKQRVKQYADAMSELNNQIKAFGQRIGEQQKSGAQKESISINYKDAPADIQRQMEAAAGFQPSQTNGVTPKEQLQAQKTMHGMQLKEVQARQKMQHADAAAAGEQQRENLVTASEINRGNAETQAKIAQQKVLAQAQAEAAKETSPESA